MQWKVLEMDQYIQAKEYVDTALIPLVPIDIKEEIKSTVSMGEFISIISLELEKQFKGRVLLIPSFTYLKSESEEDKTERLNQWIQELQNAGMHHCLLLSSDASWRLSEKRLKGDLFWLPTIPLEHLDSVNKRNVIAEQIKQLVPLLTNKWQNR
ncbi:hypothetical protein BTS2_2177 [Bacillus sp. TS-2]|nr:hypothetical protein BTS2_2177 [Bacillus sp. TS-2]